MHAFACAWGGGRGLNSYPVLALANDCVLPPPNRFFGVDVEFHNTAGRLNLPLDFDAKTALFENAANLGLQ